MTADDRLTVDMRAAASLPDALGGLQRAAGDDVVDHDFCAWQLGVATALARVEVSWGAHVRADSRPDGFLASTRVEAPRLSHEIDLEIAEHGVLVAELRALHDALFAAHDDDDAPAVQRRVAALASAISKHIEHGNCLARDAASEEFGPGD